MEFVSQKSALQQIQLLADQQRHSILLEGPTGSGKTYLSKQFMHMLHIEDFQVVLPKVQDIKDTICTCLQINTPVVICIENLDTGVAAASYALLKFLEEPADHVYIAVTCRNVQRVPDTIVSRSAVVTVAPPILSDIEQYAIHHNAAQYVSMKDNALWQCVRTLKDVDIVLSLTDEHLEYLLSLPSVLEKQEAINSQLWALQRYPDNAETPIELVIRYIMCNSRNTIWRSAHSCIQQLSDGRIAAHAVLAKFLFEYKYLQG